MGPTEKYIEAGYLYDVFLIKYELKLLGIDKYLWKYITNLALYKPQINLYRADESILNLGKIKVITSFGNTVYTYRLERTVCDIINNRSNIDLETVNKAVKNV